MAIHAPEPPYNPKDPWRRYEIHIVDFDGQGFVGRRNGEWYDDPCDDSVRAVVTVTWEDDARVYTDELCIGDDAELFARLVNWCRMHARESMMDAGVFVDFPCDREAR